MRILILRLGSALTPQPWSDVGHADEMLALMRHLAKEHTVLAIGRFGIDPGIPHEKQTYATSFPNEEVDACMAEFNRLADVAQEFAPDAIVTVIGPSGSACYPGQGIRVQAFSANYCGPVVAIWNRLPEVPRICILNDPRNIIRLKELEVWPSAVLSQANEDTEYRVRDRRIVRHYRYHKTQNWGQRSFEPGTNDEGIGILAHRHCDDSRVSKNREAVWDYILDNLPTQPTIVGRGWPMGSISKPHEFLQRFTWGPMIPIGEGWVTAKFGQYARAGCMPRPYDGGGFLTYDRDGLMIPLDHPIRWNGSNHEFDPEWLQWAVEITEPDFTSLDNVLSDYKTLPNYEVWGGYETL
jgi:hypothetical protein